MKYLLNHSGGSVLLEGILVFPLYLLMILGMFALAGHFAERNRLAALENSAIFAPANLTALVLAANVDPAGIGSAATDRQYLPDTDYLVLRNYALSRTLSVPEYLQYGRIAAVFFGSATDDNAGAALQSSAAGQNANQIILRNTGSGRDAPIAGLTGDRNLSGLCGINPALSSYAWSYQRNAILNKYSY